MDTKLDHFWLKAILPGLLTRQLELEHDNGVNVSDATPNQLYCNCQTAYDR